MILWLESYFLRYPMHAYQYESFLEDELDEIEEESEDHFDFEDELNETFTEIGRILVEDEAGAPLLIFLLRKTMSLKNFLMLIR